MLLRGRTNSSSADCPAVSLQLVDLGEPAYSDGSQKGCRPQEEACTGGCGYRGWCEGGLSNPRCECPPGRVGPHCSAQTTSSTLGPYSFVNMALSFKLAPEAITTQLRIRTSDIQSRDLLNLSIHPDAVSFSVHVSHFLKCVNVSC